MNEMKMEYVYITPEIAKKILEKNGHNRSISHGTVQAYANDIISGNWNESVGTAISIDENGVLRDGQHRLSAIILAKRGIHTWVCRGVSSTGIYDTNRIRKTRDQISILKEEWEGVYKSPRYICVANAIIGHNTTPDNPRRKITSSETMDFTDRHKDILDEFFLKIPQTNVLGITLSVVWLSLFMAYVDGVNISTILSFYDVLCSGMSTKAEEFPIVAYRNYLKDISDHPTTITEISRCQYALKKYMVKSCSKNNRQMKNLIWPFPFESEAWWND